jgi:ACT domain-containing protein
MFLTGDMSNATIPLKELQAKAVALGEELGVEIRLQSEDIFAAMHKI